MNPSFVASKKLQICWSKNKMLHRSQEVYVHVILNMATCHGLDDAMAAHEGPALRPTWGRYFGTVARGTGQSIIMCRTSSGKDTSAKQTHDKQFMQLRRCRRPPHTPKKQRKKNTVGCSHVISGHELPCSSFERLSFLALLKMYATQVVSRHTIKSPDNK